MHDQNKSSLTNFWFGFSLGAITLTIAGYLLGTKNGRILLKKILELSENLEENLLLLGEELEENILEKSQADQTFKSTPKIHSTLRDVLEKIKVRRKII